MEDPDWVIVKSVGESHVWSNSLRRLMTDEDVIERVDQLSDKNVDLLESLEMGLIAMQRFDQLSDTPGGPHLSTRIKELGEERDEARTDVERMKKVCLELAGEEDPDIASTLTGENRILKEKVKRLQRFARMVRLAFLSETRPEDSGD